MQVRRLNRLANWAALLVIVLVLAAALAPLPSSVALILGTLGGTLGGVVVLTWLTAGWLTRPRRPLWLVGVVWALLAIVGSWMVGYALALRGDPARFVDGRVDPTPFGYGAWFGVLIMVAGGWHLRWLSARRSELPR
ncbi:hypothetical protein HJ590_15895 [Naumannella sp. ID2617S]|nr:hypothetical protein [Naumannella sp. ID2617S]